MNDYDEIAQYYDSMYSDRKDDIEFYVELAGQASAPVLECGCGTGRILLPIAQSGIEIWGFDSSARMLSIAERKTEALPRNLRDRVRLLKQDMHMFDLSRSFPLCIVPFRAFQHLLSVEEQDQVLMSLHRHLDRKGKLALDMFAPSYEMLAQNRSTLHIEEKINVDTGRRFTLTDYVRYEHASQLIYVERFYEEVDEEGGLTRKVLPFKMRYVFRYEMQALLEKNGFSVVDVLGTFDRKPYDYYSGEMIFIAEKL